MRFCESTPITHPDLGGYGGVWKCYPGDINPALYMDFFSGFFLVFGSVVVVKFVFDNFLARFFE